MPYPLRALMRAGKMNGFFTTCPQAFLIAAMLATTFAALPALASNSNSDALPDLNAQQSHAIIELAPQGRWIGRVETRYSGFDHWYNDRGEREKLGADYDNLTIDASVFPTLALFGPGANIGTTRFSQQIDAKRVEITLGYGVTPDLTVGMILPLGQVCSDVQFSTAGATLGSNPLFNPALPIGIANSPFAPVGGPIAPLDTAGAVDVLTNPVFGFNYKAPANRCQDSWGDPTFGFLARVHEGEQDNLVLGLGLRLGIARDDDPDDLFDAPLSDSSNDLVGLIEHYRDFGNGWDSRLSFEGNLQFSDHVVRRVPASSTDLLPAANTKANVKRDLGDWYQADIEIGKSWGNWRASGTAHFFRKGADRYYQGNTRLTTLEKDTHQQADQWRLSLSWSGYQAFKRGNLPLPLAVKLETQQTAGGTNMPDIWDWYLTVTSVF